jgi:hypothetical protein
VPAASASFHSWFQPPPTAASINPQPPPLSPQQQPPPQILGAGRQLALRLVENENRFGPLDECDPKDHKVWRRLYMCIEHHPDGRMVEEVLEVAAGLLLTPRQTPEKVRAAFKADVLSRFRDWGEYLCARA